MTVRVSAGLRDFITSYGSVKHALTGGIITFYSGSQPSSADAAPTGTAGIVFSAASGAVTSEVRATGTLTLTGGGAGSVDTVTVNSINILGGSVPYNTSLSQTATDVATQINNNCSVPEYTAVAVGAVITITAPPQLGAVANTWAVAATTTTITTSNSAMAGGVSWINGLKYGFSAAGVISKLASQVWSGVASNSVTVGWFRMTGSVADSGIADSTESQIRIDGAVSTSGAQINMSNTTIASGAVQTLSSFAITLPTS